MFYYPVLFIKAFVVHESVLLKITRTSFHGCLWVPADPLQTRQPLIHSRLMLKIAKNVFIYNSELLFSSVLNLLNSLIGGFYDFMLKSNRKKKK